MSQPNDSAEHSGSTDCSSSVSWIPFDVDLDAICDRPILGPLWFEYDADDSRCPSHLLAPQRLLPDGHPRKLKQFGSRMIDIPRSQIVRD